MSTLDINQESKNGNQIKTIFVYFAVSILCIVVNKIYGIYGHGVSSNAMTWMFLYPLIGGALFYLLIKILIPGINRIAGYRIFYNIYNSGIAILTVGSFLNGILYIAGTSSKSVSIYYEVGWLCIASALILLITLKYSKNSNKL